MASFNKVILLGNLTRDPQLKYLPSQTAVAEFGLACNRKFKTQSGEEREEVTFIDCTAFGRQAEIINQYCQKGRPLFIDGRLKYDSWEDKQGGGKRSKVTVVIENFQLLGGPQGAGGPGGGGAGNAGGGGGGGYEDQSQRPRQSAPPRGNRPAPQQQSPQAEPFGDEQEFKEDDIPF